MLFTKRSSVKLDYHPFPVPPRPRTADWRLHAPIDAVFTNTEFSLYLCIFVFFLFLFRLDYIKSIKRKTDDPAGAGPSGTYKTNENDKNGDTINKRLRFFGPPNEKMQEGN